MYGNIIGTKGIGLLFEGGIKAAAKSAVKIAVGVNPVWQKSISYCNGTFCIH